MSKWADTEAQLVKKVFDTQQGKNLLEHWFKKYAHSKDKLSDNLLVAGHAQGKQDLVIACLEIIRMTPTMLQPYVDEPEKVEEPRIDPDFDNE